MSKRLYCPICGKSFLVESKISELSYYWSGGNRDMVNIECPYCVRCFQIDESDFDTLREIEQ